VRREPRMPQRPTLRAFHQNSLLANFACAANKVREVRRSPPHAESQQEPVSMFDLHALGVALNCLKVYYVEKYLLYVYALPAKSVLNIKQRELPPPKSGCPSHSLRNVQH